MRFVRNLSSFWMCASLVTPLLVGVDECELERELEDAGETGSEDAGDTGATDAAAPARDSGTGGSSSGDGEDASSGEDAAAQRPDGDVCGGIAGLGCEAGEFCNYEKAAGGDGCDVADGQGVCQPTPPVCTEEYDPVCGCDGRTYSNACFAHASGASVARDGACEDRGEPDAGGDDGQPDAGKPDAAEPDAGEACGPVTCGVGLTCCNALCGICTPPGVACVQGCAEPDAGQPDGATCGGIAGLQCAQGQFCNYEPPVGQGCDGTVADTAGQCEPRPQVCTHQYAPVCGCDHATYGNRCAAHAAGVSVMHEGPCTETECEAVGGRPVYSTGAGAPPCNANERDHGPFVGPNGEQPFEPTRCCVPR